MGIRKSVGKNKKSNRPTEAASVEREGARRKADNALHMCDSPGMSVWSDGPALLRAGQTVR